MTKLNISIQQDYYMANLRHFLTKLLHDQPSTFLNNKCYIQTNLQHFLTKHMTIQHFLTTKLLHDQTSTFLNETTT